ncbi:MAG: chemotaxis protein CheA [Oscillospiraceae bacterium]|jgi:two-component system chemotaxis sensor kinase CheA|nr:chemotaxis protein CheA [Oscillospiraceae bacterium]
MANDPMLDMFIFENVQLTERLEEILIECENMGGFTEEHINEIFRIMHTIKGSSAMMEYEPIAQVGHHIEDMFFFIRDHHPTTLDSDEIADICLNAVDFFKQEIAKIQSGGTSDGETSAILARIERYMAILSGKGEAAPAPEAAPAAPPAEAVKAASVASDGGLNCYKCKIIFDDGCKMENIRAYQIVNTLSDYCDTIETIPGDLLEDCADEIIADGAKITMYSDTPIERIRAVISEALFVKSFELLDKTGKAAAPAPVPQKTEVTPMETVPAPVQQAPIPQPETAPPPAAPVPEAPKRPALDELPAQAVNEIKQNFISVNVDKLDKLMDLMGEIVISVSMVVNNSDLAGLQLDNFERASAQLQKNTGELQGIIMSVRMLPISSTFHKMSRIVRDTGKKLGKEAELVLLGEETEVDKNIIDNLSDPLMHIIRNAMDHGLEDNRDERTAAGKNPVGRIVLEARNSGSDVIISCSDDGRGLNRDKIIAKAKAVGLMTRPESEYTDKDIYQFIMHPGFSTNEAVTELSGRGVGMDVVKKNIEKVGGTVDLTSTPGQGMTVNIRIPLTLAILPSIEISVGKNNYLIPTLNIREAYKPNMDDIIIDPDGKEMIMYRGECFSIVRLHQLFNVDTEVTNFQDGIMIMIEDDDYMTCVFADVMVGEQQAVVKPIPSFITERIGDIYGIAGCTLLGDGSISLIIDVKSLTH